MFPPRVIYASTDGGSPWDWVSVQRVKKTTMMGLPGRERNLTISSAVWIQYTKVLDRETDGHRATAKTALTHSVAR